MKRIAVDRFTEFFNPFVTYLGQTRRTWPVSTGENGSNRSEYLGVVWDQGEPKCSHPGILAHIVFNVIGGLPCGDLVDCWCVTQHAFGLNGKVTGHSSRNRGTPETISVYNMNAKRPQIIRPTSVQFQSHLKAFPALKIDIDNIYIYFLF